MGVDVHTGAVVLLTTASGLSGLLRSDGGRVSATWLTWVVRGTPGVDGVGGRGSDCFATDESGQVTDPETPGTGDPDARKVAGGHPAVHGGHAHLVT